MEKILIIDDDPDVVEGMRVVLESKNYKVDTANGGDEGLRKANQDRPDLIILDVMMETRDKGFNVAKELKRDSGCKNIPILMLTAITEVTGLDFKNEAGDKEWLPVDDYCEKPLKADVLISKVKALLGKRGEK